jgi:mono/diheme cytochrome c family protein
VKEGVLLRPVSLVLVVAFGLVLVLSGSALAAATSGRLADSGEGAKVYRQWCGTCHGDRGQGLTEDWLAKWPEGKQNCWQSKCHAANHPPEGFVFPKEVPAVIGREALAKFGSAQDLYAYIRATMPYWNPNMLSDDQYRAFAIFLVEANYSERGLSPPAALDQDLASVPLHPAAASVATGVPLLPWLGLVVLPLLIGLGIGTWLWRRSTS